MIGKKTIRADINLLNPVGYEGKERTDRYENELIHQQTIPIWVAYYTQAKKRWDASEDIDIKDLKLIYSSLSKANKELALSEIDKHRVLRLKEVVRRHDGIINTLYSLGEIDADLYHRIRTVHYEQTLPASMSPSKKKAYLKSEKEDALELMQQVFNYSVALQTAQLEDSFALQLEIEMRQLKDDLLSHVLTPLAEEKKQEHMEKLKEALLNQAHTLELGVLSAIQEGDVQGAEALLQKWIQLLGACAKKRGENIKSKKPHNLAFVGHSLGGAYAQVFTCHHLIDQHPVHAVQLSLSMRQVLVPLITKNLNGLLPITMRFCMN